MLPSLVLYIKQRVVQSFWAIGRSICCSVKALSGAIGVSHQLGLLLEVDSLAEAPVQKFLQLLLPREDGPLLSGHRLDVRGVLAHLFLAVLGRVLLAAV